jgi:hypothetical protein
MTMYDDLDWLPNGAWLTQDELKEILVALRALVNGTDAVDPNRSHVVTIAVTLGAAIDRSEGEP